MRPRKRILLVEGSELKRSTLLFLLRTRGFRVAAVASPDEALDVLKISSFGAYAKDASLNLLITDRAFKDAIDGDELCRLAKIALPGLPTLLLYPSEAAIAGVRHADRLLARSVKAEELLEVVRELTSLKRGPKKKPCGSVPASDVRQEVA